MKADYLKKFVKDLCCNYDRRYKVCIDGNPCKVLVGVQCGYFERAVLGSADYKYRLPGYDFQKLFALYAEHTKTKTQLVNQRVCDCGSSLRHRQRFCDKCSQKRRKDSNLRSQKKHRLSPSLSVSS